MTDEEINCSVARKLGWKEIDTAIGKKWVFPSKDPLREYRCPEGMDEKPPDCCHSIAAAWEIIDAGYLSGVIRTNNRWQAYRETTPGMTVHVQESLAETAPMAICLAFLKL